MFAALSGASPFQLGPFDALLGALCLVILASVVVFILVAIWVYRDAESRGMSGGLWLVLLILASLFFTFVGGLIVLVIYLVVRSEHPAMYGAGAMPYPGYGPPMYPPPAYPPGPIPPQAPAGAATAPPPAVPAAPPVGTTAAATCRNCGAPLNPGAGFCGRCGARV